MIHSVGARPVFYTYNYNVLILYMKNSLVIGIVLGAIVIIGGIALLTMSSDTEDTENANTNETVSQNTSPAVNSQPEEEAVPADDTEEVMEEEVTDTIADLATNTDSLSTLVAALTAADLVDVFTDTDAEYTVFAPTNDAFAEIQSSVDTLLLEENKADLQNVLQYHVVEGAVYASDLKDGMEVTLLNGDTATVTIDTDGTVMIGDATVVTADIKASNGVVHVIDTVLLP